MSFRKSVYTFFIFMGLGISAFSFVSKGLYPIAIVNYKVITASTFQKDYSAAYLYFRNALITYGTDPLILEQTTSKQEIKRAALDKMISDMLIRDEAEKRIENLESITDQFVNQVVDLQKIAEAAEHLYGLSPQEFRLRILNTQAHKELLQHQLTQESVDFTSWLKETKARANIFILLPELDWNGESVVAKS